MRTNKLKNEVWEGCLIQKNSYSFNSLITNSPKNSVFCAELSLEKHQPVFICYDDKQKANNWSTAFQILPKGESELLRNGGKNNKVWLSETLRV